MAADSIKFDFPQKKSSWRSCNSSFGSIAAFKNFFKFVRAAFFLRKLNKSSCNGSDHFPKKGVRFNLKNKQIRIFLVPEKKCIVNISFCRKTWISRSGKRGAVNFTAKARAHFIQRIDFRAERNKPSVPAFTCKRRIFCLDKISVQSWSRAKSWTEIFFNFPGF